MGLLFSCKTLIEVPQGDIHSYVSPLSDPFLLVDTQSQRKLLIQEMNRLQLNDPELLNLLEDTQWLIAGLEGEGMLLQLSGDFPRGKLKLGLGSSSLWQKESEGVYSQGDLLLNVQDRSRILLSRGLDISPEAMPLSLLSLQGDPLVLQASLGTDSMAKIRRETPILRDTVQAMEFQLSLPPGEEYQLRVTLRGEVGKEKALNASGRVYLLSLVGRKIMDSEQISQPGRVEFYAISLKEGEWMEIADILLQGVEL